MPVKWHGDEFIKTVQRNTAKAVDRSAVMVQRAMKKRLSLPGTGRMGKVTRASAPGKPPAVQTGDLRRSVQIDRTKVVTQPLNPKARIGTAKKYAPFLEFGTSKMKARPFASTTLRTILRKRIEAQFTPARLMRGYQK